MKITKTVKLVVTKEEAEILHKAEVLLENLWNSLDSEAGISITSYCEIFDILTNDSDYDIIVKGY